MIDDPASDDELVFATDFYARKFGRRRTGSCTELLRAGLTLTVDDTYRGNPETGVAGLMRRRGYRVFFAENTLWHSLFGLLFWDELFESDLLNSSFDWVPHCLKDRSFVRRFATQIDEKLDAVRSGNALNLLLRPIAAKWGRPNGIFARNFSVAHFLLAAALVRIAELDQAQTAVQAGLVLDPSFTIRRLVDNVRARGLTDPAYLAGVERVAEGMRLAGVPEG